MAEFLFGNFRAQIGIYICEIQQSGYYMNTKESTLRNIIIKFSQVRDNENIEKDN